MTVKIFNTRGNLIDVVMQQGDRRDVRWTPQALARGLYVYAMTVEFADGTMAQAKDAMEHYEAKQGLAQ